MREIKLKAADGSGEFAAFIYEPKVKKPAGVVVVIQEIFGVNDALRAVKDDAIDGAAVVTMATEPAGRATAPPAP